MTIREHRSIGYLRLARHHLVDDHDEWSRRWALQHMLSAMHELEKSGALESDIISPALKPLMHRSHTDPVTAVPKARVLWDALDALESLGIRRYKAFRWMLMPLGARLLRDLGIVLLTIIVLAIAYRKYHDLPVNLWSKEVPVMDVVLGKVSQDFGSVQINQTVDHVPVMIAGRYFPSAIGTHANSAIQVDLRHAGKFLQGSCGYPDSVTGAQIYCAIEANGLEIWRGQTMDSASRIQNFRVSVEGQTMLTLKVSSLGPGINGAHAAWVDLRVSDE